MSGGSRGSRSLWRILVVAALASCPARAELPQGAPAYRLEPRQLAAGVYVIEGAVEDFSRANGCNIINTGFIVTAAGVVVINTGPSRRYGEAQRAAIARVTDRPVRQVLNLNLHPDYFFGNQAYADVPTVAFGGTIAGMRREGGAYADNLYRLCGDWMKGTESTPARQTVAPGELEIGGRRLAIIRLQGHTDDDMVVIDRESGVAFAGGLVFMDRTPTTPHARLPEWLAALDALEREPIRTLVPSHGHVRPDRAGIAQTRDYLGWLEQSFRTAAAAGLELNEVLASPVPGRFAGLAALRDEYPRNVFHLYPRYERRALGEQ